MRKLRTNTPKHVFRKGLYVISDPCYLIDKAGEWEGILEQTGYFGHKPLNEEQKENPFDGMFLYKGFPCFAYPTYYGDGEYDLYSKDNNPIVVINGVQYTQTNLFQSHISVDSGLIGILPRVVVSDISPLSFEIFMEEDFEVWRGWNGDFHFGGYTIETKVHS